MNYYLNTKKYNSMKQFTISNNWILRYDPYLTTQFTIYNIENGYRYEINNIAYVILKILEDNYLTINQLISILYNLNIKLNNNEILQFIKEMYELEVIVSEINNLEQYNYTCNKLNTKYNVPVASTPYEIEIHLTNKCNLFCKHCAYNSGKKIAAELNLYNWYNLINQIENLKVHDLIISGGEPLCYPYASEILEYLTHKKIRIALLTNGTLLNDNIADSLANSNFSTSISLDGDCAETHNMLRGCLCYDKTITGIEYLCKHQANFSISSTIHKKNIHELEAIVKTAIKFNAQSIGFILLDPIGRAKNQQDLLLDKEDISKIYNIINEIRNKYLNNIEILLLDQSKPNLRDKNISTKQDDYSISCPAGTSRLAIRSDGKIFPCVYAFHDNRFCMGSIINQNLDSIWSSSNWDLFRGQVKLTQLIDCKNCEYKENCDIKICRLRSYYDNNNFYSKPPNCIKDFGMDKIMKKK